MAASDARVFYYDLISPYSCLAAFRLEEVMPGPVVWRPIWAAPVIAASGRDWRHAPAEDRRRRAEIEERAARYGMPGWRWPPTYPEPELAGVSGWQPPNTLAVMRLASLAHEKGVGEEFARRAFDLAFVEGRDITPLDDPVIAAAVTSGLDAEEARAAPARPEIKQALRANCDEAVRRGVVGVPTVAVGDRLFWGDDRLEEAAGASRAISA